MNKDNINNTRFLMGLLGLLTALATVVNNMYSPAMPMISGELGAGSELGLTAGMLGLALGQLIFGPLSDAVGRRKPLLVSMALLVAVSIVAACSSSLLMLVPLRLLQGFAAGGGVVIARSVATDCARDKALIRLMAAVNVINGVMPIVTPMVGGAVVSQWGWRSVLWCMAMVSALLWVWCALLRETMPDNGVHSRGLPLRNRLADVRTVCTNRGYVWAVLHQGCALAILFGNLAATPFLLSSSGFGAGQTGLFLGVNGIFTAIGAGSAAALPTATRCVRLAGRGMLAGAVVACVGLWLIAAGVNTWSLLLYEAGVCVALLFVGMTLTGSTVLALERARAQSGTASALLGAVGFVVGGVVAPLTASGAEAAGCTFIVAALAAWWLSVKAAREPVAAERVS